MFFSDTAGQKFILGLLGQSSAGQTTLEISASSTSHVNIEAPFIGLSKQLTVSPGVAHITSLDSLLRETGSALSFKGILVTSDYPISVRVIDDVSPSVGGYLALPANTLGIDYIVTSFESRSGSELLVISVNDRTRVNIHLKTQGQVVYRGNVYTGGEIIYQTLDTFQTLQLQSTSDLTGTLIKADGKVAVFSGGACAVHQAGSSNCGFIVEQMLPVETWKSTYIVPNIATDVNTVRILARDDSTVVRFAVDNAAITVELNATESFDKDLDHSRVGIVTSNRPISVSLVTGNDFSIAVKPSMTLVPSVSQFETSYRFNLTDVLVSIVVPASSASGIRMNNRPVVQPSKINVHIPLTGQDFSLFDIRVTGPPSMVTLSHENSVPFGAIVYGIRHGDSFSLPLGLRLDLTASMNQNS